MSIQSAKSFVTKCSIVGITIMFLSMSAGELFVNPTLFGGFLRQPSIWFAILLEMLFWMMPCFVITLPLLILIRKLPPKASPFAVTGMWVGLGALIAGAYLVNTPVDKWAIDKVFRADIAFSWTIPCSLIVICFIYFSLEYLRITRPRSQANHG